MVGGGQERDGVTWRCFSLSATQNFRTSGNAALELVFTHVKVGNIVTRRAHRSGHGVFLAGCRPNHGLGSQNGSRTGGQGS
jgi:hypothetical protein